jgi:cyclophilin family peptidyl-prolyl cis-trans isomerase
MAMVQAALATALTVSSKAEINTTSVVYCPWPMPDAIRAAPNSRDSTAHLDGNHTCFGKVTEGLDLVGKIVGGDGFRVEVID